MVDAALCEPEGGRLGQVLQEQGYDLNGLYYMADHGVAEDRQKEGRGGALVRRKLDAIPRGSTALMRTNVDNHDAQGV